MATWDFNVSFHADFQREFDRGVLVANEVFGKDFSLELLQPWTAHLCINIAFHFDGGWDCGQIELKVDSSKHTESFKQIYESDVQYPSRGGTVFHRLQLDLYGVGTRRPHNWYLGWCCPGQCHHSVSRKEKTSSGSCVRGHLMDSSVVVIDFCITRGVFLHILDIFFRESLGSA